MLERSDKAPIEYVEFAYRREMGYTPNELDEIPSYIVERDLFFMHREGVIRKLREQ